MSFSADISKFINKTGDNLNTGTKKVVVGLGSSIIRRNPVGTPATTGVQGYIGGRSKANWQYGLDQIPVGDLEEFDADSNGSKTINKLISAVPNKAAGHVHYITNNVSYITYLESGSSQQAREGMVARTVLDFKKIVNESFR